MKRLLLLCVFAVMAVAATAQKPTKNDVVKAIKGVWEKSGEGYGPKETVVVNDVKFGTSEKSNLKMQYEGVPKGGTVTHAKIDFSHTKHYTDGAKTTRRIMTAWVFKDQFGDWKVMNVGTKYVD